MISIPAVLITWRVVKHILHYFELFYFILQLMRLKTNNDSTDLTDNIPWTTQHTPSSTVTNWLWSLMHSQKIISRGFEMDSPKFPSWPMTCCDGWFFWDPAEGDGSAGCRLWHWGAFSQQFRQKMLSFNSWVKFQSGMEDSVRAWAPNRTTTSKLEPHAAHRWCPAGVLLICLKRTCHMFYPQKAPTYPILKHFFLTEGKKKSIKSVKYPKTHKWRSIHGINLRERP